MNEEIDVELFISLVSQNPVIWDENYQGIRSRMSTKHAWRNVASQLHPLFIALTDKEKNAYINLLTKKWRNIYHDQMSFLNKITPLNETKSGSGARTPEPPDNPREADKKDGAEPTQKKPKVDLFARFYDTPADGFSAVGAGVFSPGASKHDRKDRKTKRTTKETDDPYVYFFHSLLPSVRSFTNEEMLQLQSGVIKLVQNIRGGRSMPEFPMSDDNAHDPAYMIDTQPGTSSQRSLAESLRALLPPRSNSPGIDSNSESS